MVAGLPHSPNYNKYILGTESYYATLAIISSPGITAEALSKSLHDLLYK